MNIIYLRKMYQGNSLGTFLILWFALNTISPVLKAEEEVVEAPPASPSYSLNVRDQITFSVLNEEETTTEQRIDGQGRIRVPYLGSMEVAGLTIREAEVWIEEVYVDQDIYIDPEVTIRVVEYAVREVSVLGEVNQPGKVIFPIESESLDIREVISEAGGFTNIARSRRVIVTRETNGGKESFRVNVDQKLRKEASGDDGTFLVQPGDVVYVPERFF